MSRSVEPDPGWSDVGVNMRWGVKMGWRFAVMLCALSAIPGALILLLTILAYFGERSGTSEFWVPGTFYFGLRFLTVFPLFITAGILGGVLGGLLRPLLRWRIGAAMVGTMAGVLFYAIPSIAVLPLIDVEPFSSEHLWPALLLGVTVGGLVALKEWKPPQRDRTLSR